MGTIIYSSPMLQAMQHIRWLKKWKKNARYWGEPNKFNILLLTVVVLDPRYKMSYMNWAIDQLFVLDK